MDMGASVLGLQRLKVLFEEDARHLPVLTGLRGCAALWVFLFHLWFQAGKPTFAWTLAGVYLDLTPPIAIGFAGVPIFFVLSGFLLSLPFAEWQAGYRDRPVAGRYLIRRVLRVFPAYYAQLAVLIVIAWLVDNTAGLPDIGGLLRHLGMLFVPPPVGTAALNGVWWTLPIEFSFYIVLPILAFLLKPGRWGWLLLVSLLSMWLWRHAAVVSLVEAPISLRVITSWQLPGSMDMFGIGMLAAVIHVNRRNFPPLATRILAHWVTPAIAMAILLGATYWLAGDRHRFWADYPIFYLWTPVVCAATAVLILSGMLDSGLVKAMFGNRIVVFLGLISYSLYLWHLPVIDWLIIWPAVQPLMVQGFLPSLLVTLSVTLAVSTLSYLVVERPAMHLRK